MMLQHDSVQTLSRRTLCTRCETKKILSRGDVEHLLKLHYKQKLQIITLNTPLNFTATALYRNSNSLTQQLANSQGTTTKCDTYTPMDKLTKLSTGEPQQRQAAQIQPDTYSTCTKYKPSARQRLERLGCPAETTATRLRLPGLAAAASLAEAAASWL